MKSAKWRECRKRIDDYFDQLDREDFGKVIVLSDARKKREARARLRLQRLSQVARPGHEGERNE